VSCDRFGQRHLSEVSIYSVLTRSGWPKRLQRASSRATRLAVATSDSSKSLIMAPNVGPRPVSRN
jgi:hypothetical protein